MLDRTKPATTNCLSYVYDIDVNHSLIIILPHTHTMIDIYFSRIRICYRMQDVQS